MPYVTPPTQSTGDVIGATQWNRLGSNDIWMAADGVNGRPICRAFRSTNQTILNNTYTPVQFNNNGVDNAGSHSTSVNPSRFTAPVDGHYRIGCNVVWSPNATGERQLAIINFGSGIADSEATCPALATFNTSIWVESIVSMTAGQYTEAVCRQTSGGSLGVVAFSYAYFEWVWKR